MKKFKSNDITLGSILAAMTIVVSYIGLSGSQVIQSVVNIINICIISVYAYRTEIKTRVIFSFVCFILSLILLPPTNALIHFVPSILYGFVLGASMRKFKSPICASISFLMNVVTCTYEFALYFLLYNINIFNTYISGTENMFSDILQDSSFITTIILPNMKLFGIIFVIFDLFISALLIYYITKLVVSRLNKSNATK